MCVCVCEEQQHITSFWEREKKTPPKPDTKNKRREMYRNCNNEYQRDQRVSEQLLYIVCRGAGFGWLREYFAFQIGWKAKRRGENDNESE